VEGRWCGEERIVVRREEKWRNESGMDFRNDMRILREGYKLEK
jgi:hypothetical protein